MFNQRRYRPMGVADLFDEAFDLYKNNFVLLLGAAAIVYVPLQVLMMVYVDPSWGGVFRALAGGGFDLDAIWAALSKSLTLWAIAAPVYAVFYAIVSGALITIAANRYLDRPAGIAQAYKVALRRFIPLLISQILPFLLICLGTLACFIPGLILSCLYICIPQVVLLESGILPFRAKRRAWQLAQENFWRILGCLILLYLIDYALFLAGQSFLYMVIHYLPMDSLPFLPALDAHEDFANEIANSFSTFLVYPYAFTLMTVLYYDFRIRQEGYDMVILADHLEFTDIARSPAGALPQARLEIPTKRRKAAR